MVKLKYFSLNYIKQGYHVSIQYIVWSKQVKFFPRRAIIDCRVIRPRVYHRVICSTGTGPSLQMSLIPLHSSTSFYSWGTFLQINGQVELRECSANVLRTHFGTSHWGFGSCPTPSISHQERDVLDSFCWVFERIGCEWNEELKCITRSTV